MEKGEACEQAPMGLHEFDDKFEILDIHVGEFPEYLTSFPNGIELEGDGRLIKLGMEPGLHWELVPCDDDVFPVAPFPFINTCCCC